MKYEVKQADADLETGRGGGKAEAGLKPAPGEQFQDKCERPRKVRWSTVGIGAMGLALLALAAYTATLVLADYRFDQPCLSENCVSTDVSVVKVVVSDSVPTHAPGERHAPSRSRTARLLALDSGPSTSTSGSSEPAHLAAAATSRILSSLNKSVEPCQDFYEFACGGWIQKNPVPEWATSWDQLAKLREILIDDLREVLEAKDEEDIPQSVAKAKALYRTCIDTDKLEADGVKPIQQLLESLDLTPQPPRVGSENFTWQVVAGRARRRVGISVLLSLQISEDVRNTTRNRIVLEQISPGFSDRYLVQPEKFAQELSQYHRYIRDMVSVMDNLTDGTEFADDIIQFSKSLAKIMTPMEVRRSGNHLFHDVTLLQLIAGSDLELEHWSEMNWPLYLEHVFANTSVIVDPNLDRMIVMDLPYLQKLSSLLNETRPLTVERFVWWSIFSTVAPMTLSAFRELGFQFSRAVYGVQQRTPRWKSCTTNVNANFGVALSYLYVRTHFDNQSRQKSIEMIEDVRAAFAAAVQQLDWMDTDTREKTLSKLKAIRNFVGYPSWLFTKEQLDKRYEHAEVIEGQLFATYLKLTWATVKKSFETLRKKPDRDRWVATATTVNAFYSATLNSVTFPAGILQPPFYGNGIEALNYGSIGAIMGHEITHGFDDQGRRYDEEGNLKQWWSASTLQHYHERVQCIIDQYSRYHMPQLPDYTVHGVNTQGENIADNGGLRAALNAYRLYAARCPQERRDSLPGLPYTPDQLFFLGFAQIWCGNSTVGALKSKLVEGVHSPNKVRVIGTLSNTAEFAAAWRCPTGSPMNPQHKCVLW